MQVQTDSRYELLYPKTNIDQVDGYIKPWKVGDVRITSRTDLSDNWLLCNGNTVAKESYPELYAYGKKLAQAGPDQNTWYTPNFTGDTITGNLAVFKECNGIFYVGTVYGSIGRIYVSSDLNNWELKWNQDFGSSYYAEIPQILIQNNDVYVCYQKKQKSSSRGYYGYVKFNDGQLVEDRITSQYYTMDDMESRRLYFACDGTYFYSFGRSYVSKKVVYGKSTDLFSLFGYQIGQSSNYETVTIMTDYSIDFTTFIESQNGKIYYIGYLLDSNSRGYGYMFVTIINGVATIRQIYTGYTDMTGYLTTENNWLFCAPDGKCYISYNDGQNFSVLKDRVGISHVENFLYEENYLLLYGSTVTTTTKWYFYVYKNGVLSKQEEYGSNLNLKFFYINNIFWKGVRSYCYTGILLPTYTPTDNLSAYIKAKEGE